LTEEQRSLKAEAQRRDSDLMEQLGAIHSALGRETRERAAFHEKVVFGRLDSHIESAQSITALRDERLSFQKLRDKLMEELRLIRTALEKESGDRLAGEKISREALSAVSGESQSSYSQLREELEQASSDHQADIVNLQDALREHMSILTEHTAQIREEQALRMAGRHEMEQKLREEIAVAVGAQKNLMDEARQMTQHLRSLSRNVLEQEAQLNQARFSNASSSFTCLDSGNAKLPDPASAAVAAGVPTSPIIGSPRDNTNHRSGDTGVSVCTTGGVHGSPRTPSDTARRTSSSLGSMRMSQKRAPTMLPAGPIAGLVSPAAAGHLGLPLGALQQSGTPSQGWFPPFHAAGVAGGFSQQSLHSLAAGRPGMRTPATIRQQSMPTLLR